MPEVAIWRSLARCLDDLAAVHAIAPRERDALSGKIASRRFTLVVAGQFKRGKSSLINALIGADLLPVAVIPLTSIVTVLEAGPAVTATIEFDDGRTEAIAPEALVDYVTERGNPGNVRKASRARLTHPSSWLASGVQIVDTPGVGSVYSDNTETTLRFLPQADAVLFVLSVDQPLSAAECEFLARIRAYADRIFFALNKADLVTETELAESIAFTSDALERAIGGSPQVTAVSARGGKVAELARTLERFFAAEKDATLLRAVVRRTLRAVRDARFAAELELRSLETPLDELDRRMAHFADRKSGLAATREEFEGLLGRDARRVLLRPSEESLDALKRSLKHDLARALDEASRGVRAEPVARFERTLEAKAIAMIRDGFDAWQAREVRALGARLDAFCLRQVDKVDAAIDTLYREAADLFAIDFERRPASGFEGIASHFSYRFWQEPTALATIVSSFVYLLPAVVARRVAGARVLRRGEDLVEVQAGRVRGDIARRLDEALDAFRRELDGRAAAAVAGIEAAVDAARHLRASGAGAVEARRRELATTLQDAAAIVARVEALVAPDDPASPVRCSAGEVAA